jgi:ribosomal protein S18 acetylase RimI-like enzyme
MNKFKIFLLKSINLKKLRAINQLIPQLDSKLDLLSVKNAKKIPKQKQIKILVASPKDNPDEIIGILFFVFFHSLAGKRARIEDLVVDKKYRGLGIGKKLVNRALTLAKKLKIKQIELTSRPERIVANNLYKNLNFLKKETNVYQLEFNQS